MGHYTSGPGDDTLKGSSGNDTYVFTPKFGNDTISDAELGGKDTLIFHGNGNFRINLNSTSGAEVSNGANTVNWSTTVVIENVFTGGGNDHITGNDADNIISAGKGNDIVMAGGGSNTLIFENNWGRDLVSVANSTGTVNTLDFSKVSSDLVVKMQPSFSPEITSGTTNTVNLQGGQFNRVLGGNGNDVMLAWGTNTTMSGGGGNDTFFGGTNTTFDGGSGNDMYQFGIYGGTASNFTIIDSKGIDTLDLTDVNADVVVNLVSGLGDEMTYGNVTANWNTGAIENVMGSKLNDRITGDERANVLNGGEGNDVLTGGGGMDTLIGGIQNDTYVLSSMTEVIVENANEGTDTVVSSVSYTLAANLENLTLTGAANTTGTGNELDNILTGSAGVNTLNGGAGNDTYYVQNTTDVASEASGNGYDRVFSSVTFTLGDNIEMLTLSGTDNINGTGNAIDNIINGNTGNNVLQGAEGKDSLYGFAGNDTMDGGSQADTLVGDTGNDVLNGGADNDVLNGGAGNDTMDGGAGDDLYVFGTLWGNDVITGEESGNDTVDFSTVNTAVFINLVTGLGHEVLNSTNTVNWTPDFIENAVAGSWGDTLRGNAVANYLSGNDGGDIMFGFGGADTLDGGNANDALDGGSGDDILDGGATGEDRYIFGNNWGQDVIVRDDGGFGDRVELLNVTSDLTVSLQAGAAYQVTDGQNTVSWSLSDVLIEYIYTGSGNDNITGDDNSNIVLSDGGNDVIYALGGNDQLNGGGGTDLMDGGAGNDKYVFNADWGNDTITDGDGIDGLVFIGVTTDLTINLVSGDGAEVSDGVNTVDWTGDVVEHVTTGSGNDTIVGNNTGNSISSDGGNDTLVGGAGSDSLIGGADNDLYRGFVGAFGADTVDDLSGSNDVLDLSNYSLDAVVMWRALDGPDLGTSVDRLSIDLGGGNSVIINNYFNNNSIDEDLCAAGSGYVESILFADNVTVTLAQVQQFIP